MRIIKIGLLVLVATATFTPGISRAGAEEVPIIKVALIEQVEFADGLMCSHGYPYPHDYPFVHMPWFKWAERNYGVKLDVRVVNEAEVEAGVLQTEGFDVIFGAGGGGSWFTTETYREKIKDFVYRGGGYYGACGDAVFGTLDMVNVDLRLEISPATRLLLGGPIDMARSFLGFAHVHSDLSCVSGQPFEEVIKALVDSDGAASLYFPESSIQRPYAGKTLKVPYFFGMVAVKADGFQPDKEKAFAIYASDGHFKTGSLAGKMAGIATTYGKGRVVLMGPHPELPWARSKLILKLSPLLYKYLHPDSLLAKNLSTIVDISDREALESTIEFLSRGYQETYDIATRNLLWAAGFLDGEKALHAVPRVPEVSPGVVGDIILEGNTMTRDEVILRELPFKSGDIYDEDLLARSKARLYDLGFFRYVHIEPSNEEKAGRRDILVKVVEARTQTIDLRTGYGTEYGLRGYLQVFHPSMLGSGNSLKFRGQFMEDGQRRFDLGFRKPYLFGGPFCGRLGLLDDFRREDTYELRRYRASLGISKETTDLKLRLDYSYGTDELYKVKQDAIIDPEVDEGKTRICTFSPSLIWDRRDGEIDPRSGSLNLLEYSYSGDETGSEVSFEKVRGESLWYFPIVEKSVLALGLRAGYAQALGDTPQVPIQERFFLGGRESVRGFSLDSIGPKGTAGTPQGGDVFINLRSELEFPLWKSYRGVVFCDGGQVWPEDGNIAPLDLRYSCGLGLRFKTPLGRVVIDYGRKIDREPGESPEEWHFTIGAAFKSWLWRDH